MVHNTKERHETARAEHKLELRRLPRERGKKKKVEFLGLSSSPYFLTFISSRESEDSRSDGIFLPVNCWEKFSRACLGAELCLFDSGEAEPEMSTREQFLRAQGEDLGQWYWREKASKERVADLGKWSPVPPGTMQKVTHKSPYEQHTLLFHFIPLWFLNARCNHQIDFVIHWCTPCQGMEKTLGYLLI